MGAITFVSDAYGGSASDRQVIEKSSHFDANKKMFDKGGSIMADRDNGARLICISRCICNHTYIFERKIPTRSPGGGS